MKSMPKDAGTLFLFGSLSIFIFGGLTMIAFGIHNYVMAYQSRNWTWVEGTVTHTGIDAEHDMQDDTYYVVKVRYAYNVFSEEFEGTRISIGGSIFFDRGDAEDFLQRFTVGNMVDVYRRPGDPKESVLYPNMQTGGSQFIVGGLLWTGLASLFLWMALTLESH